MRTEGTARARLRVRALAVLGLGLGLGAGCGKAQKAADAGVPGAAMRAERNRAPAGDEAAAKPRVVILSDIGNEPDDQMSLVRLLLYTNEMDVEALIATTSTWQRSATHPETMHALIAGYGQVRPQLLLHASGWPTAEELDARVSAGQAGYGMAATGEKQSTAGSRALASLVEREDARPVWVCLWGGANTLAQSLLELRSRHTGAEMEQIVSRLRISSISDQDDAGPWIRKEFPAMFYVVQPTLPDGEASSYATWTGISGDVYYRNGEGADTSLVTNEWLDQHIRSRGVLGKLYPRYLFIMEGDTPSYLGLVDNGLAGVDGPSGSRGWAPDWGSWGGRYVLRQPYGETHPIWTQGGDEFRRATSQDEVVGIDGRTHVTDQATVWRWREAFQNDFAARMMWTVTDYAHANHVPEVVVNGVPGTAPVEMEAPVGRPVVLDAAGSHDPDPGQTLRYRWWVYPEAGLTGTHGAAVTLTGADGSRATAVATATCRPNWLPLLPCTGPGVAHVILEVTDSGTPRLTRYRRVVLHVPVQGAARDAKTAP